MAKAIKKLTIVDEIIVNKIYYIRKQKIMLDRDLAELYGVDARRLREQVKRNSDRFPANFMFQLTHWRKSTHWRRYAVQEMSVGVSVPNNILTTGVAPPANNMAGRFRCCFLPP